ncbi:MAG: DUF1670 domain-containing protein [Bacillota bacterium]
MGRKKQYRQKVKQHVNSLKSKSLYNWLLNETKEKFVTAQRMAEIVTDKAYQALLKDRNHRPENIIIFDLIKGNQHHQKVSYKKVEKKSVRLTPYLYEDIELYEKNGLKALQNSRIFRLVEEAYFQNALFSTRILSCLVNMGMKALRKRLKTMWNQGLRLPISGMKKEHRKSMKKFRATAAMQQFLNGDNIHSICKDLFLTKRTFNKYQLQLARVAKLKEKITKVSEIADQLDFNQKLVKEYLSLLDDIDGKSPRLRNLQKELVYNQSPSGSNWDGFVEDLKANHNWSQAKIKAYLEFLDEYQYQFYQDRPENSIIYHVVSSQEPAGKPLAETEMVSVQLNYCSKEDIENFNGYSTSPLKWRKIIRYSTEARKQDGLLNQSDLVFLLGVDASVIRRLLKKHDDVFIPTRGNIVDIGPGLSHAEEIIELYLQGYTETQIKKRTGHSYESIENYIKTFANVYGLKEKGLPPGLIRKTLGKSMKLINKYMELIDEYNTKENAYIFMQLSKVFKRQASKKNFKFD